jgi:uroporphyrinogen-III synthase
MGRRARVLVTRPEPGASQTAARLEALGFAVFKLPLQETVRVPVAPGVGLRDVTAVALPSASAVRHAPRDLLLKWSGLPCFAVGEATAQAAREAGFTRVVVAGGDAESLAAMIVANPPAGAVSYLCGKVRRSVFERRLAVAGIPVIVVETYDTLALDVDAEGMSSLMEGDAIDAALVYSASAAARLASLVTEAEMRDVYVNSIFICISDRVARELAGLEFGPEFGPEIGFGCKILVAEEPNETALLKVLGEAVKPAS